MAYLFEEPTSRMYNVCGIAIFLGIGLDRLIQSYQLVNNLYAKELLKVAFVKFFLLKIGTYDESVIQAFEKSQQENCH